MTLPERIERALGESADGYAAPPSELETIIVRGRRRRFLTRLFAGVGSGAALFVALAVTVAFVRAGAEPEVIVGDQTQVTIVENPATASERTAFGHIAHDPKTGYKIVPAGGGDDVRLVEAHSIQVEGEAFFGPAVSDGAGGFVYSVSDVIEGSDTRHGWVLWVPRGAATPVVVADEPDLGVGQVIGVVDDGGSHAVYTTLVGRTIELRRTELNRSSSGAARTLVEDFADGDAAGNRIIMLSTENGCSALTVFDSSGAIVPFRGLPDEPCPSLEQATLSSNGRTVAYLDRTGERNQVVAVDLATSAVLGEVGLDSRKRIISFDGSEVTLTGSTIIDVALGAQRDGGAAAEQFEVTFNSRLILQVPGAVGSVTLEEVQAAPEEVAPPTTDAAREDNIARLLEYSADGWTVSVQPDRDAGATAVDLDAFGVTVRGLGPYVLGNPIQRVADEAGHELLAMGPDRRCRTMRVSPLRGITAEDATLIVDNGVLAAIEFSTGRFALDGVTVGTSLAEATDRLADAEVVELGGATVLVLDVDGTSRAEFRASGEEITSFRIATDTICD